MMIFRKFWGTSLLQSFSKLASSCTARNLSPKTESESFIILVYDLFYCFHFFLPFRFQAGENVTIYSSISITCCNWFKYSQTCRKFSYFHTFWRKGRICNGNRLLLSFFSIVSNTCISWRHKRVELSSVNGQNASFWQVLHFHIFTVQISWLQLWKYIDWHNNCMLCKAQ